MSKIKRIITTVQIEYENDSKNTLIHHSDNEVIYSINSNNEILNGLTEQYNIAVHREVLKEIVKNY